MPEDRNPDVRDDSPRTRNQNGVPGGGRQIGGSPGPSDNRAPGGSSGSGGYGNAGDQQNMQGQQDRNLSGQRSDESLSRGERFDEQQGGGRGPESVSRLESDFESPAGEERDRTAAEEESGGRR